MAGGNREPGSTVVSKVIALFTAFESASSSMNLAELSKASGVAVSTSHRLVQELTASGFLERTSSDRYQIGVRMWEISQKSGRQLREAARPWAQDLASITMQSVSISVRQGRDSLAIERAHSRRQPARTVRVGSRVPLHSSAAGKVLLAFEPEWVRRTYLSEPLQLLSQGTEVDRVQFGKELSLAEEDGYAQSFQGVRIGASAIAVPVFHSGQIAAAVSIITEASQLGQLKQYLPALRGTAAGIEDAIRYISREALLGADWSASAKDDA